MYGSHRNSLFTQLSLDSQKLTAAYLTSRSRLSLCMLSSSFKSVHVATYLLEGKHGDDGQYQANNGDDNTNIGDVR